MLDGEILNTDSRELKSGKFLVTFDLYDGSSTITCKAFVEADKHDAVIKRLKSASGVKVNGTAQFDPFAKELGVAFVNEMERKYKHEYKMQGQDTGR